MISLASRRRLAERRVVENHVITLAEANADLAKVYSEARGRVLEGTAGARIALGQPGTDAQRLLAQKHLQRTLLQAVARERALVIGAAVVATQRLKQTSDWVMIPYPSQVEAVLAATDDAIVELATGEGKTLVAAIAAAVWALPGTGVHLVTANGYLASRDAEWMRPLYAMLGLTAASIDATAPWSAERQNAYKSDVTYASVSEVGFDYLRDHTARTAGQRVQRLAWGCLVDEADAVLIDDAGTPLIISGASGENSNAAILQEADGIARTLWGEQERRIGVLVNAALKAWEEEDVDTAAETMAEVLNGSPRHPAAVAALAQIPGLAGAVERKVIAKNTVERVDAREIDLLMVVDPTVKTAATTELGQEWLPLEWRNSDTIEGQVRRQVLMQALRAYSLFERDRDYLVEGNTVGIIDPRTGRVLAGRQWSDGLHQAVEIKEGIGNQVEMRTSARCTIQNYFQRYSRLAGMTGTAKDASEEFANVYQCKVVRVAPNRPSRRVDAPDLLFPTSPDRLRALIAQVRRLQALRLPVVVAAPTVYVAEDIAAQMTVAGLNVRLLTARVPAEEAAIIAEAGRPGAVTITTAMAGRGTDIIVASEALASRDAAWCQQHNVDVSLLASDENGKTIAESGGLHVLALGRWGSRRVDRQLKGRAGRQGEPGWTQTLVAIDDPLVLESGVSRTLGLLGKLGVLDSEGTTSSAVTRLLEKAQKALAAQDAGGRQRMAGADAWLNKQRDLVYGLRDLLLEDPTEALDWVQTAAAEGVEIVLARASGDVDVEPDDAMEEGSEMDTDSSVADRKTAAQALVVALGDDPQATLKSDEETMRKAYGDGVFQEMACAALDLWWTDHLAWYDGARASTVHQSAGGGDVVQVLSERLDGAFEDGRQDICVQITRWFREKALGLAAQATLLDTDTTTVVDENLVPDDLSVPLQ